MRYSKQRELILQTVQALSDHPTAEEIHTQAAPRCPGLSLGTVYRNLNLLVELGEIRKLRCGDGADHFDALTIRCAGTVIFIAQCAAAWWMHRWMNNS